MGIQTAGEQKYYDLIKDQTKRLRTSMIIWTSLLAVALIAGTSNVPLGAVIGVVAIYLAVRNIKAQKELHAKVSNISDKAGFYNQLISPTSIEFPAISLLITTDYLLSYKTEMIICSRSNIQNVEQTQLGQEHHTSTILTITEQSGIQYEIASCNSEDAITQCNLAYITLKDKKNPAF